MFPLSSPATIRVPCNGSTAKALIATPSEMPREACCQVAPPSIVW